MRMCSSQVMFPLFIWFSSLCIRADLTQFKLHSISIETKLNDVCMTHIIMKCYTERSGQTGILSQSNGLRYEGNVNSGEQTAHFLSLMKALRRIKHTYMSLKAPAAFSEIKLKPSRADHTSKSWFIFFFDIFYKED